MMVFPCLLDVLENESSFFFEDWSDRTINDDDLRQLTTFKNCIVTSHQAFLTKEALENIINTTLFNATEYHVHGKRMSELTNTLNAVDRSGAPVVKGK